MLTGFPFLPRGGQWILSLPFGFNSHRGVLFHSPCSAPRSSRISSSSACAISNMSFFLLPLYLPCAAAAPEERFSSCLSREEKCFSSSLFEAPHKSLEIHPLTAEADDKTNLTESRHRVLNDCTLRFLPFDLQNFIEVQNRFVCVAHLELLIDHPCNMPSREKSFFSLSAAPTPRETLLLKSPLIIFSSPLAIFESRSSKVVLQLWPSDRAGRLQFSKAMDFADAT